MAAQYTKKPCMSIYPCPYCHNQEAASRLLRLLRGFVKAVEMFEGLSAKDVQWWANEARITVAEIVEEEVKHG